MTRPSLDRSVRDEAITPVRAPYVRIPFGRLSGLRMSKTPHEVAI
jgi:hypothetical protein